jgi:glycosyltransferase involved in cell wall biosynthesis
LSSDLEHTKLRIYLVPQSEADMFVYSLLVAAVLLALLLVMSFFALNFVLFYLRNLDETPLSHQPKVGILMPLRGSDPFLKRCLVALMNQQYDNYVIRVVVDNPLDPAHEVVNEVLQEYPNEKLSLEFLADKEISCCLKNSALRQAYRGLPVDCEFIILLDGDANPDPHWITNIVAGFKDPQVGIACGIRWYSPQVHTMANLTRHVWNAGAVLQMHAMQIGWGGSLGLRKSVFEELGLYEKWGQVLFEDTYTSDLILKHGYKFRTLPLVTMVNEESISFRDCMSFITRQLLNLRLYNKSWLNVFLYGLSMMLSTVVSMVFGVYALFAGEKLAGMIALGSLACFFLVLSIFTWIGESAIDYAQRKQGKPRIRYSPLYLPLAEFLVIVAYPICMLNSYRIHQVTWRGIIYQFNGPFSIKRLNYEPFLHKPKTADESL